MIILGVAGLVDVEGFLHEGFPGEMASNERVVQGMDAAAALIIDGNVAAAVAQERFDKRKKSSSFPYQAIDYCLASVGMSISEVDAVCANFDFGRYKAAFAEPAAMKYYDRCLSPIAFQDALKKRYGVGLSLHSMDHHLSHLYASLISAPFDECLAVVMDAAGEIGSTSIYHLSGNRVRRLGRFSLHQSLGAFYSLITRYLGFFFNEDEYKVMGLASFGDPERYAGFFESAIQILPDGVIRIPVLEKNSTFVERLFFLQSLQAIEKGLGLRMSEVSTKQKADISAALQKRFTDAVFHVCNHYAKLVSTRNLIWSGGCAENCVTAAALRNNPRFERIHIGYASGDDGTALGSAAAHSFMSGVPLRMPGQMPFFGPEPQAERTISIARKLGLCVTEFPGSELLLSAAAADVASDKIIAICRGRMEYGSRALGNRSLLALPSNSANKDRINLAIKKRQNYRPFAPAVPAEDAHRYFELGEGEAYPYMTMLTRVRRDWVGRLPAVVHVDGTARVQTVSRCHNAEFHRFLSRLGELTGVPVVLNTSYNVNHQPIVCDENDAINSFIEMNIDALYLSNIRIRRN